MNHIIIKDRFNPQASLLRQDFESRFSVKKDTSHKRFVWDYWYVQDQYQFLRTPAYHFFKAKVYNQFHTQLVNWGREHLGCHDVSPPWLSYYIDGMQQKPHSDVPHGPWAWVYSLTVPKRIFTGGETFIFKPEVLNYWSHFSNEKNREQEAYMDFIAPDFNRLIVFDPRYPHGVTPVVGTHDPLQARLVIHGWFVEPRPYVVGGLTTEQAQLGIENVIYNLSSVMQSQGEFHGTLSLRLDIEKSGVVKKVTWLTNTVLSLSSDQKAEKYLKNWLSLQFKKTIFPKATKSSAMTIPLLFR